ncbi:single-stranded-DNA-specific exonuclease RecJ [Brockia lithotrophica]|uniref:Single-stranded-DNA-specific exonuclease RecJ n=1 Tax=Brockia lithotrophica TaxID=933949 RepID=A0A660L549_9BACL|nr:single-stranded-DNA-specific exonuclease RecJ [Brockia lithotrophica]RKQ89046.1 single-stranded-DNA-specific exonuclease RecJ [Brockia lithotrophica]
MELHVAVGGWTYVPLSEEERRGVFRLAEEIAFPPSLAEVLWRRGYRTPKAAKDFLALADAPPADPLGLPGTEAALARLLLARRRGERVLVYGDYDADGVLGTAILVRALRAAGIRVRAVLADRFRGGYGLHAAALEPLLRGPEAATLVVTVDTGSTAAEDVRALRALGADVVVTDHHALGESLPPADVFVSPRLLPEGHPLSFLSGAGVAYLLARALLASPDVADEVRGASSAREALLSELEAYAALATVADVVPLWGENRPLVRRGLKFLRNASSPALTSLLRAAGVSPDELDEVAVGFRIAPLLNAAGRMATPYEALHLLLAEDAEEAESRAALLRRLNEARRREVGRILEEISEADLRGPAAVLCGADWHEGVLGIVASRLEAELARPVFVFAPAEEEPALLRGSARARPPYDLVALLAELRGTLPDAVLVAGGHREAAGLTVRREAFPAVREAILTRLAARYGASERTPTRGSPLDARLTLEELENGFLSRYAALAPFGEGNPLPRFLLEGVEVVDSRFVGRDGAHVRLNLARGSSRGRAIAFRQAEFWRTADRARTYALACEVRPSTFRGRTHADLHVLAAEPRPSPAFVPFVCREDTLSPSRLLAYAEEEGRTRAWAFARPGDLFLVLDHGGPRGIATVVGRSYTPSVLSLSLEALSGSGAAEFGEGQTLAAVLLDLPPGEPALYALSRISREGEVFLLPEVLEDARRWARFDPRAWFGRAVAHVRDACRRGDACKKAGDGAYVLAVGAWRSLFPPSWSPSAVHLVLRVFVETGLATEAGRSVLRLKEEALEVSEGKLVSPTLVRLVGRSEAARLILRHAQVPAHAGTFGEAISFRAP